MDWAVFGGVDRQLLPVKTVHKSNQTGISRSNQSIEFVHFSGRHIQTNGIRPNFDPRVLDEQNYENNNSIITLNRKN